MIYMKVDIDPIAKQIQIHRVLKQKYIKVDIDPIAKTIWLQTFFDYLHCFDISYLNATGYNLGQFVGFYLRRPQAKTAPWHCTSLLKDDIFVGSGCGSVGRAVAYETRGPQFESSHRQTFISDIWVLSTVLKRRKEKK